MKPVVLLLSFVMLLPVLGCNSNRLEDVPAEFRGEWATGGEKYDGFTFEITDRSLLFLDVNGDTTAELFPIQRIERDEKEGSLYTIYYETNDGETYPFSFYYDPSKGGVIQFKNQRKFLWNRVRDG